MIKEDYMFDVVSMDYDSIKQDLYNSETDLKRLEYLYGTEDCQDDILKLRGRIELLKEIIKEEK
jgi:hypothetical protein